MVDYEIGETPVKNRKTRMQYWATLDCGCKLPRQMGTYEEGNMYELHEEWECELHGAVTVNRTHGLST